MVHQALLSIVAIASVLSTTLALNIRDLSLQENHGVSPSDYLGPCKQIASSVSSASAVYYNGSSQYASDISHWGSSSTQSATCSFEPGTAEDIGIALHILDKTRTPFAVKGGGHTSNPGFSSTTGVQIAMSRFNQIAYNSTTQTATLGAGLVWDDAYSALEQYGANVVGARATGVGVAGLALGGGYSWLSNQYGLTVDTMLAYELVMPNGTVASVTEASSPDLFFALKGGFNNYGIVTSFTLKTFPQGKVWGGYRLYISTSFDLVNQATADFTANNIDPKASIIVTYNFYQGFPSIIAEFFYDAPTAPPGIFDEFMAIPYLADDTSTRSFLSLIQAIPSSTGQRAIFNTVSVLNYSTSLLNAILNESIYWAENIPSSALISYDVETFLPSALQQNASPSPFPPSRDQLYQPLNIYFAWTSPADDHLVFNAARTSADYLQQLAIEAGQSIKDGPMYPNYAIFGTPLQNMYGHNVWKLQQVKSAVDPDNVMGLTGGWKFGVSDY